MIRDIVKKTIRRAGFRVEKIPRYDGCGYDSRIVNSLKIPDLDIFSSAIEFIPGMIEHEFGKMLYILCFMQSIPGNVVEVGSWQGRSTAYLAKAVADSRNGIVYAIDHFRGNVGKEQFYKTHKHDLSDLQKGFEENMKSVGLSEHIRLLNMSNNEAVMHVQNNIRFLFLDGDHSEEGVKRDIELFSPLLLKGALVVFHDFQSGFPSIVEVIENTLKEIKPERLFACCSGLVLRI